MAGRRHALTLAKFKYLHTLGHFHLELCLKLWILKISPTHVYRRKLLSTSYDKGGRSVR